jgi:hypothetical protein
MAHSQRMSQQFYGSQQQNRSRKKEDESDALMRLVSAILPLKDFMINIYK